MMKKRNSPLLLHLASVRTIVDTAVSSSYPSEAITCSVIGLLGWQFRQQKYAELKEIISIVGAYVQEEITTFTSTDTGNSKSKNATGNPMEMLIEFIKETSFR